VSDSAPSLPIEDPAPAARPVTAIRGVASPPIEPDAGLQFIGEPEAQAQMLAAFAGASAVFGEVRKETAGQVGNQKFKYADLAAIMKVCRPALAKAGLVLIQSFGPCPRGADWMRATTVLAGHGAMIRTEFDFIHAKMMETSGGGIPLQKLGVAQGYIRRMQVQALLGISPDNDPDAAPSEGPAPTFTKQATPPPANTRRGNRAKAAPTNKPDPKGPEEDTTPPPASSEDAAPTPDPSPKEEPKSQPTTAPETETILDISQEQKLKMRQLASELGLSKIPKINEFIQKYMDKHLTISELDGKQADALIDLLKKRAVALTLESK